MAGRAFRGASSHGEEATLVEHLDELRTRLFIASARSPSRSRSASPSTSGSSAGSTEPLPGRQAARHASASPSRSSTSIKVSLIAGFALALPVDPLPALELPRAGAARSTRSASSSLFVVARDRCSSSSASRSATSSSCRGARLPHDLRRRPLRHPDPGELLLLVRHARAARDGAVFELPVFILALVRLGVLTAAQLRRNRRIGYFLMLVIAVLLPTVDPVSLAFEALPLVILFELSIRLATVMERRWAKARRPLARPSDGLLRRLGAPRRGRADPGRRGRASRGRGSRRSARPRSSARASGSRARRSCRASSTRTRTSSTRSTRASATGSRSGRGSSSTSSARRTSAATRWSPSRALGAAESLRSGITTVGDY